ncbi:MAG: hypothetical protein ACREPQ_14070 [Rhodanobacter sp.]
MLHHHKIVLPGMALLGLLFIAHPQTILQDAHSPLATVLKSLLGDSDSKAFPSAADTSAIQTCIATTSADTGVPAAQLQLVADRWDTDVHRQDALSGMNSTITGLLADQGIPVDKFVRNPCVNVHVAAILLKRHLISPEGSARSPVFATTPKPAAE